MFSFERLTVANNGAGNRTGVLMYDSPDDTIQTIVNTPNYFLNDYKTPIQQSVFNRFSRVIVRDALGNTYNIMVVKSGDNLLVKGYALAGYPVFIRRLNLNLNQSERPGKGYLYSIQAFADNYTANGTSLISIGKNGNVLATIGFNATNLNGQMNVTYNNKSPNAFFTGNEVISITNDQPVTGDCSIKIMLIFMGSDLMGKMTSTRAMKPAAPRRPNGGATNKTPAVPKMNDPIPKTNKLSGWTNKSK